MHTEGTRIGNFTWITPSFVIGTVATISVVAFTGWCWSHSLADPAAVPWLATGLVTVVAIPVSVLCAYWSASHYVIWVAVGEDLTFATPLGSHTDAWENVLGVEFETECKAIPLVLLPLELVVGQSCTTAITLCSGRVLRGRIDRDDALVLHGLLSKHPRLDTHFVEALSSPRDTMRTFVDAVMEDDLFYASKFLDFSGFDAQAANDLAEPCAKTLKDVIDRIWYIDYEEIPDDPESPSPYVLAAGSDQEVDDELLSVVKAIKIAHETESGFWRFDRETVSMIVNEFMNSADVGDAGQ